MITVIEFENEKYELKTWSTPLCTIEAVRPLGSELSFMALFGDKLVPVGQGTYQDFWELVNRQEQSPESKIWDLLIQRFGKIPEDQKWCLNIAKSPDAQERGKFASYCRTINMDEAWISFLLGCMGRAMDNIGFVGHGDHLFDELLPWNLQTYLLLQALWKYHFQVRLVVTPKKKTKEEIFQERFNEGLRLLNAGKGLKIVGFNAVSVSIQTLIRNLTGIAVPNPIIFHCTGSPVVRPGEQRGMMSYTDIVNLWRCVLGNDIDYLWCD